jgi:hypothetical protein
MMQTMKLFILLLVASSAAALVPSSARRTFLAKAPATAAALLLTTAAPAFANAADGYSLDVEQAVVSKPEKKSSGNGSMAIGGVLAGGFALSLPFFLPNLMRMVGVNNGKNPDQ